MSNELNEKYLKHYVDIMSSTLNEQVTRNISMQANAKVANEMLQELQKSNEELRKQNEQINQESLKTQTEKEAALKSEITSKETTLRNEFNQKEIQLKNEIAVLKNTVTGRDGIINELKTQVNNLNQTRIEYDKVKHQIQHIDTFKNELIKTKEVVKQKEEEVKNLNNRIVDLSNQIVDLNNKIIESQSTPPAEVSVEVKKTTTKKPKTKTKKVVFEEEVAQDGGSF